MYQGLVAGQTETAESLTAVLQVGYEIFLFDRVSFATLSGP